MSLLPVWMLVGAGVLFSVGGLCLVRAYRHQERAGQEIDRQLEHLRRAADGAGESARRAHVRLDNQQRQLRAMAEQLGWADEHAHTRVLTEKVPKGGPER